MFYIGIPGKQFLFHFHVLGGKENYKEIIYFDLFACFGHGSAGLMTLWCSALCILLKDPLGVDIITQTVNNSTVIKVTNEHHLRVMYTKSSPTRNKKAYGNLIRATFFPRIICLDCENFNFLKIYFE